MNGDGGADLVFSAGTDGLAERFLDQVAGLGSAEAAQVVHESRELHKSSMQIYARYICARSIDRFGLIWFG